MKTEKSIAIQELEKAKQEFFKDKPEPKDEEELKKQYNEFMNWYNNIRKQSDTGKTPAEMYKEIYGKTPPEKIPHIEDSDNELDEMQEEAIIQAEAIFKKAWKTIKQEVEGISQKETCKYSFITGFLAYMDFMDNMSAKLAEKAKQNPEEFNKILEQFKSNVEKESEE